MFILANGERIETQQYLVTYDQVQLTVDRRAAHHPTVHARYECDAGRRPAARDRLADSRRKE